MFWFQNLQSCHWDNQIDNTTISLIRRWLIIKWYELLIFPTLSCSRQGSGRHNNDEWSSRCQWRLSLERLGLGWAGLGGWIFLSFVDIIAINILKSKYVLLLVSKLLASKLCDSKHNLSDSWREGSSYQIGWFFGKIPNGLRPPPYLIFVIFFTRAKFLENKIYTKKMRNYDKIHGKLPIFCVITAKYTVNCQFFALNL